MGHSRASVLVITILLAAQAAAAQTLGAGAPSNGVVLPTDYGPSTPPLPAGRSAGLLIAQQISTDGGFLLGGIGAVMAAGVAVAMAGSASAAQAVAVTTGSGALRPQIAASCAR